MAWSKRSICNYWYGITCGNCKSFDFAGGFTGTCSNPKSIPARNNEVLDMNTVWDPAAPCHCHTELDRETKIRYFSERYGLSESQIPSKEVCGIK